MSDHLRRIVRHWVDRTATVGSGTIAWLARGGHLVLGILALVVLSGMAAAESPREYDLKAAFLYHFTTFVEWPSTAFETPRDPFIIGVYGEDPFGPVLDQMIANEYMDQHPIVLRRLRRIEEADDCHMVFICHAETWRAERLLRRVSGRPVLTVTDQANLVDQGGIVGFEMRDGRLRLRINLAAAELAGLTLSSKLLELSSVVDPKEGGP